MVEAGQVLAELCGDVASEAPDEIEYIAGMLADPENDPETLVEEVTEMLEGIGIDDAAAVAAEAVKRVLSERAGGASGAPKMLGTAVKIADTTAEYEKLAIRDPNMKEVIVNSNAQDLAQVLIKLNDPKERKRRLDKSSKVVAQNKALQKELDDARANAVMTRLTQEVGAIGSIDAGPFDLPNPGGGANLIDSVTFTLVPGRRYGLIGRNGKGKSTLLKWVAARREGCSSPAWRNSTIHYVTQEVILSPEMEEQTPAHYVLDADVERRLLLQKVDELEKAASEGGDTRELEHIHDRLNVIGAASAPGRVEALLTNLGFSPELRARKLKALSGGWRVRCALAAALFAQPEILLLDEPTNHLSIEAVLWLARELSTSPAWQKRIIVIVSHDRSFLDEVTTDTLHLSGVAKRVTQSPGNFSAWAQRRQVLQDAWNRNRAQRATKKKHLTDFIETAGVYANVMKQVNMKKKQVEKIDLEELEDAEANSGLAEDEELPLRLEAGGVLEQSAVVLKNVGFKYPGSDTELFSKVDISVDGTSRIVLLGENGAGKTTLVNVLMGGLEATTGTVERDRRARIHLVNQHHADQLDLDSAPLLFMLERFPGEGTYDHEQELRRHLNGCGIGADLCMAPIRGLSGGQRARVSMAAVSFARPHVLILDEPTNNLDIEAVTALVDCIQKFQGGVVVVSHDQYFVSSIANTVLLVGEEPGKVTTAPSFEGYVKQKQSNMASM